MKKIAILTVYGNFNFGNKLQNYAVQKTLNILCVGYEVETIKIEDGLLRKKIKQILKRNVMQNPKREEKFLDFNTLINYREGSFTRNCANKSKTCDYEYLIYGSDQVWNYGNTGCSKLLLGFASKKEKNISFSASFGTSNIPQKLIKTYKNGLENFKSISVREDAGKKIVEDLTGRCDVEVLVDPTMLLTKDQWQEISKKPDNIGNEKYILNYFLGELSEKRKNTIYEFANKNGYKVINILDKNDPFYESGPNEFIYLEEHASLICTDSFHSCVFGILMNTPFIVFDREDNNNSMSSRIETLLSKFKLENRKFSGSLNNVSLECDYTNCYRMLSDEIKKSHEFLKKALGIEGE